MTSHARRSTIESAMICEQLLKRVVEEVNAGNGDVRVTTKMYTVGKKERKREREYCFGCVLCVSFV